MAQSPQRNLGGTVLLPQAAPQFHQPPPYTPPPMNPVVPQAVPPGPPAVPFHAAPGGAAMPTPGPSAALTALSPTPPATLAIQEAGFFPAVRLVMKTMPFSMVRVGALALGGTLSTLALGALVAATALLAHFVHPAAGGVIFLVGAIAFALLWVSLVERWLFAVDCGYTAILTELITRGEIGNGGQSQFAYGREVIQRRFGDFKAIRDCQGHVNYTLNKLFRTVDWLTDWLPFDVDFVTDKLRYLLVLSTRHAGQTVLSYGLARGASDLARSSVDGLCYYVQGGKEITRSSIGGLVADKILSALFWVVSLSVVGVGIFFASGAMMPALLGQLGVPSGKAMEQTALVASVLVTGLLSLPLATLLTWTLREAFIRPVLLAMVVMKFHLTTWNQPLDPSIKERLRAASDRLDTLERLT